jgi:hypothetical protein
MPVTDSRVRQGVLTIDGDDFSCQPTSVSIVPDNTAGGEGTELEVLCGDKLTDAGDAASFGAALTITAIQDFTNAAGLVATSWTKNGTTVPFEWQATASPSDKWTGKVTVQAVEVGGEVGQRITTPVSWTITELFLPPRMGGVQVIPNQLGAVPITGVVAGAPGSFQPGDATLPSSLSALKANSVVGDDGTNKPQSMWSSGQYVVLGDASEAYWTGINWQDGRRP